MSGGDERRPCALVVMTADLETDSIDGKPVLLRAATDTRVVEMSDPDLCERTARAIRDTHARWMQALEETYSEAGLITLVHAFCVPAGDGPSRGASDFPLPRQIIR
ncbi:MAG: hypothetical protein R3F55_22215 [Alphaproteobacteria bacterium]